jgi:DNA-directed RNA polymerase subunit M/transcription elongation factor TFIIS
LGYFILFAAHHGQGPEAVLSFVIGVVALIFTIIAAINKSQNAVWKNGVPYCPKCNRQISLKSSRPHCRSCGYNLTQSPPAAYGSVHGSFSETGTVRLDQDDNVLCTMQCPVCKNTITTILNHAVTKIVCGRCHNGLELSPPESDLESVRKRLKAQQEQEKRQAELAEARRLLDDRSRRESIAAREKADREARRHRKARAAARYDWLKRWEDLIILSSGGVLLALGVIAMVIFRMTR